MLVILSIGMAIVLNSRSSTALFMISSQFQVLIRLLSNNLPSIIRICCGRTNFSGSQDTISLCRTSLKLESIWVLILVKRKLIIAQEKIVAKLHH